MKYERPKLTVTYSLVSYSLEGIISIRIGKGFVLRGQYVRMLFIYTMKVV